MLRFIFALLLLTGAAWAQDVRPMAGKLVSHRTIRGEDLVKVALQYRLGVDHLAFANGFPITTLEVAEDTPVFIPGWRILPANPPRNGIVINLAERLLYLYQNGRFVRYYPISIGDESAENGRFQTPTGSYSIIEKIKNPTWYPPSWAKDRTPVGPGPNNPLGERWIGLSLPRTGVHGTNDPLNIGNSVTHGCMRTHPALLRELYDSVQVGYVARIEYETAKVGRGPDGALYIANYPDVYKKSPSVEAARRLLKRLNLKPARDNFDELLKLQLGVPLKVKGTGSVFSEWSALCGVSEE
ncbi:L,D-transpeptidase [bacterium]|nr:L,D-transpeptidase [bacterium]